MKSPRIAVFGSLIILTTTLAHAQFGLYGSPEALRLPSAGFSAPANGGYGAPANGGYGAPANGGYGAPANGGYGAPANGSYGAPANGSYGAPANGSYGAPANGGYAPQTAYPMVQPAPAVSSGQAAWSAPFAPTGPTLQSGASGTLYPPPIPARQMMPAATMPPPSVRPVPNASRAWSPPPLPTGPAPPIPTGRAAPMQPAWSMQAAPTAPAYRQQVQEYSVPGNQGAPSYQADWSRGISAGQDPSYMPGAPYAPQHPAYSPQPNMPGPRPMPDPISGDSRQYYGGQPGYDDYYGEGGFFTPSVYRMERALKGAFGRRVGCGPGPWYATTTVMALGRDKPDRMWTSYQDGNRAVTLTDSDDLGDRWRLGGELRFGRRFLGGQWAVEGSYWTLDASDDLVEVTDPLGVKTSLSVNFRESLLFGSAAELWFDDATAHRLERRNEFHSVEVNVVRNPMGGGCGFGLETGWSVGTRFFRFEETLLISSVANSFQWGDDPTREAFLDDRVSNSLLGVQLAAEAGYRIGRLRLIAAPKLGLYHNHTRHFFHMHAGDGTAATSTLGTGTYPVESSEDGIAFLTQVDVALAWQFAPKWSARIGYHLIVIAGVALADDQLRSSLGDIDELGNIDTNGQLILHGASAGVMYNF